MAKLTITVEDLPDGGVSCHYVYTQDFDDSSRFNFSHREERKVRYSDGLSP